MVDVAVGMLKVCTDPLELIEKSEPDVPVLKVCDVGVNPFKVKLLALVVGIFNTPVDEL